MPNFLDNAFDLRALLTDTLPYEVPVVFSNDRLYKTLGTVISDVDLKNALDKITTAPRDYTVPYSYDIRKSRFGFTKLGIIHPLLQTQIAKFYTLHSNAILASCSRSDFSLRRPLAVAQRFTDLIIKDDHSSSKSGIVHETPDQLDHDISHVISYFIYERYNLLGKFIELAEFIELEKKFARLRTLDVSKCFFNIYTHSITWAVKDKAYAKQNRNAYSFEADFDRLMQKANYSETNGIVIGPEASRIFAEIILQDVDRSLKEGLTKEGKVDGKDYSVRRYVDDFYIFANSDDLLDDIDRRLRDELEFYKLFVNDSKSETLARPFVSKLTLARDELQKLISNFSTALDVENSKFLIKELRKKQKALLRNIKQIRLVVAKFDVEFGNISGWLLTAIRNLMRRISFGMPAVPEGSDLRDVDAMIGLIASLLDIAFYVCAVDLRVRSTYSICQIVMFVQALKEKLGESHEILEHVLVRELVSLVNSISSRIKAGHFGSRDAVELCNVLICGAHFIGTEFVRTPEVAATLRDLVESKPTYFGYIAAKFCLLKDGSKDGLLAALNKAVDGKLMAEPKAHERDTETYLLLCDHLASPDVTTKAKRQLFDASFGGQLSEAVIGQLPTYIGFVDWSGMHVNHLLNRKELRPVYSWA